MSQEFKSNYPLSPEELDRLERLLDNPDWPLLLKYLEPVREHVETTLHRYTISEKEHAFECGQSAILEDLFSLSVPRIREMKQELLAALAADEAAAELERSLGAAK